MTPLLQGLRVPVLHVRLTARHLPTLAGQHPALSRQGRQVTHAPEKGRENVGRKPSRSALTLRAHQHHRHLRCVPVAAEPQVVVVDCLEADLVLQAEDKHHSIDPGSKLRETHRLSQPRKWPRAPCPEPPARAATPQAHGALRPGSASARPTLPARAPSPPQEPSDPSSRMGWEGTVGGTGLLPGVQGGPLHLESAASNSDRPLQSPS